MQASINEIYFSYFSTKAYVVGTQKNHLIEMALLHTQNTLFLNQNMCWNW